MQNRIEMMSGVPVVQVSDQFDRTSDLDTVIEAVLAHDPLYVIMDFTHATFINSYGIAILIKVMKRCRQRGGDVLLANVPQSILAIFEVVCLDRIFPTYPNISTALAAATSVSSN